MRPVHNPGIRANTVSSEAETVTPLDVAVSLCVRSLVYSALKLESCYRSYFWHQSQPRLMLLRFHWARASEPLPATSERQGVIAEGSC